MQQNNQTLNQYSTLDFKTSAFKKCLKYDKKYNKLKCIQTNSSIEISELLLFSTANINEPQVFLSQQDNDKLTHQKYCAKCLESITEYQWGLNCRINSMNALMTNAFHKLAVHKDIKCLENAIRFEKIKVSTLLTVKPHIQHIIHY